MLGVRPRRYRLDCRGVHRGTATVNARRGRCGKETNRSKLLVNGTLVSKIFIGEEVIFV